MLTPPFRVQVQADQSATWVGNGVAFPTLEAAAEGADKLFQRWTLVRRWRVIDALDQVVAEGPR